MKTGSPLSTLPSPTSIQYNDNDLGRMVFSQLATILHVVWRGQAALSSLRVGVGLLLTSLSDSGVTRPLCLSLFSLGKTWPSQREKRGQPVAESGSSIKRISAAQQLYKCGNKENSCVCGNFNTKEDGLSLGCLLDSDEHC